MKWRLSLDARVGKVYAASKHTVVASPDLPVNFGSPMPWT
jgi:hypothetical protein